MHDHTTTAAAGDTHTQAQFKHCTSSLARAWLASVDGRLCRTGAKVGRWLAAEVRVATDDDRRRHVTAGDVVCYWTVGRLAEAHGCTGRTVERGIRELKAAGLVVHRTGRASTYSFPKPVARKPVPVASPVGSDVGSSVGSHLEPVREPREEPRREPSRARRDPRRSTPGEIEFLICLAVEDGKVAGKYVDAFRETMAGRERWRNVQSISRLKKGLAMTVWKPPSPPAPAPARPESALAGR